MTYCANHPTKQAYKDCKKCGKALCRDCAMQTDIGVFCSQVCYTEVKEFQGKVETIGVKKGSGAGGKIISLFNQLMVVIVALGIFWFVLYWLYGADSPGDVVKVVRSWFGW